MATQNLFGDLALDATVAETNTKLAAITKAEDSAHVSGDAGVPIFGIRSDSDASTADDGDYTILKLDEQGRLKVSSKPASYQDITGDITAIQATIGTPVVGGTVAGDVSRASNITAFCTGTFSAVNCTFEGSLESSGDTNWFGIQAVRSNANTVETTTGSLSAQPVYGWEMSVNALKRVRVRATARTSGTQSWRFVQGTYATEPIPAIQTHAVTLTSTGIHANATVVGQALFRDVALTSTDVAVKATSGRVYTYRFRNPHATDGAWVHFYNATIANTTIGTTVPVWSVHVPANATVTDTFTVPLSFATAISLAATTSELHTGTTAPTTALVAFVGYL